MSYTTIKVSHANGIGRVALAREAQLNAIDLETTQDLADASKELADADLKVVLLTGVGKAFSVGGDIAHFIAKKATLEQEVLAMAASFHEAIARFHDMPAPLVVAVNGVAAGGGFSLVCGADLAIAKRSAKFVSAYTRSGLTPDGGGTWFLPRLVGPQRAFHLMAMNPTLTADEALAMGIIGRVVDDASFDAEVENVLETIARLPSGAAQSLKKLIHASSSRPLAAHLAEEARSISKTIVHPETLAKLDAFMKK